MEIRETEVELAMLLDKADPRPVLIQNEIISSSITSKINRTCHMALGMDSS